MTTATKAGGAVLPVVAWSLMWPMDAQRGTVNARTSFDTQAEADRYAAECMQPDRLNANPPPVVSIALTLHAPAQATIDALRAEVERLTRERDRARNTNLDWLAANSLGGWVDNLRNAEQARRIELAALKSKQIDVEAVMWLADDYAGENYKAERFGMHYCHDRDAAREALRAELTKDRT